MRRNHDSEPMERQPEIAHKPHTGLVLLNITTLIIGVIGFLVFGYKFLVELRYSHTVYALGLAAIFFPLCGYCAYASTGAILSELRGPRDLYDAPLIAGFFIGLILLLMLFQALGVESAPGDRPDSREYRDYP